MELYLQISPTLRCCTRPPSAATVNFKILQHLSQFKEIKQPLLGIKIPAVSQSPFLFAISIVYRRYNRPKCVIWFYYSKTQIGHNNQWAAQRQHPTDTTRLPTANRSSQNPASNSTNQSRDKSTKSISSPPAPLTSTSPMSSESIISIPNQSISSSQVLCTPKAGQKSNIINCTSPTLVRVVTERIPYRLVHLPPQNPENAFTLLHQSLLGFKDLFKVNGLMCVKDTMIGVSTKNTVKVWMNPNFAVNVPEPKPLPLKNLDPTCH